MHPADGKKGTRAISGSLFKLTKDKTEATKTFTEMPFRGYTMKTHPTTAKAFALSVLAFAGLLQPAAAAGSSVKPVKI